MHREPHRKRDDLTTQEPHCSEIVHMIGFVFIVRFWTCVPTWHVNIPYCIDIPIGKLTVDLRIRRWC